ncbi:MAG TPA: YcxB family protein [Phycisphaerae bacterium]|nr:YcxB family protein [Phycisphaerae bacterium]
MDQTCHFTLTPQDATEFLRHFQQAIKTFPVLPGQPSGRKRSTNLIGWTIILALALLIFVLLHKHHTPPAVHSVPAESPAFFESPSLYIAIFVVSFLVIFIRIRYFQNGKKLFQKFPDLGQPQVLRATDDFIAITSPTAENRYTWPHFAHFFETPRLFILFNSSKAAHLLPKRAFPDDDALNQFRALAQSRITKAPAAFPVLLNASPSSQPHGSDERS